MPCGLAVQKASEGTRSFHLLRPRQRRRPGKLLLEEGGEDRAPDVPQPAAHGEGPNARGTAQGAALLVAAGTSWLSCAWWKSCLPNLI